MLFVLEITNAQAKWISFLLSCDTELVNEKEAKQGVIVIYVRDIDGKQPSLSVSKEGKFIILKINFILSNNSKDLKGKNKFKISIPSN